MHSIVRCQIEILIWNKTQNKNIYKIFIKNVWTKINKKTIDNFKKIWKSKEKHEKFKTKIKIKTVHKRHVQKEIFFKNV